MRHEWPQSGSGPIEQTQLRSILSHYKVYAGSPGTLGPKSDPIHAMETPAGLRPAPKPHKALTLHRAACRAHMSCGEGRQPSRGCATSGSNRQSAWECSMGPLTYRL